jgi:hypothetical protein
MAALTVTLAKLREEVQRFMGYGRSTTFSGMSTAFQGDVTSIINRGLRQFYYPPPLPGETSSHQWSFLMKSDDLPIPAPLTPVNTVTVTGGTATMSGGTLPQDIRHSVVQFGASGVFYDVVNRNGNTTFTISDTTLVISTATTATFYYAYIDLDGTEIVGTDSQITYNYNFGKKALKHVNSQYIRRLSQSTGMQHIGFPEYFSIEPHTWPESNDQSSQDFRIMVYPFPEEAMNLNFHAKYAPQELTNVADQPLGAASHSETIMVSCLAVAEEFGDTPSSKYRELFMQRLAASVMSDRTGMYAGNLGYNGDYSDIRGRLWVRETDVGYVGPATPTVP